MPLSFVCIRLLNIQPMALKQNDFNIGLSGATTDQFVRYKVLIDSKNSLLLGKPLVQFHCTDIIWSQNLILFRNIFNF